MKTSKSSLQLNCYFNVYKQECYLMFIYFIKIKIFFEMLVGVDSNETNILTFTSMNSSEIKTFLDWIILCHFHLSY